MVNFFILWLIVSSMYTSCKHCFFKKLNYPLYLWYAFFPCSVIDFFVRCIIIIPSVLPILLKDPTILEDLKKEASKNTDISKKELTQKMFLPFEPAVNLTSAVVGLVISYVLINLGKF